MDRKWWTLVAVCTATFMLLLDITIVNVALPSIERDLGADLTDLQWVVDAYALTLAALLLTGGSLADRVGRRLVFVIGLVDLHGRLRAVRPRRRAAHAQPRPRGCRASAARSCSPPRSPCSPRPTADGTAAPRSGSGAPPPARRWRSARWSAACSPRAIGWEAIFFVNVPIGIAAVALTLALVEESKDPDAGGLDVPGTVLFSGVAVRADLRPHPRQRRGLGQPADRRRAGRRGRADGGLRGRGAPRARSRCSTSRCSGRPRSSAPPSPRSCCPRRCSRCSSTSRSTSRTSSATRALESGVRFMPVTLLSFVVAPVSGKLAERLGVRWFIAGGLALVGAGLLLMGGLEAGDDWTALLAGFMVAGGGIGMVNPALATAAVGFVDPRRAGMASGINSTFRQVGIATGIAAWGAIFQHVVRDEFVRDAARAGLRGAQQRGGERGRLHRLRRRPPQRQPAAGAARRAGVRQRAQPPAAARGPARAGRRGAVRRADPPRGDGRRGRARGRVARRLRAASDARHPRPGARRGRRRELLRRGGPRRPRRPAADARRADRPRAACAASTATCRSSRRQPRDVPPGPCCSCRRWPRPRSASTCAAAARSPSTCCWRAARPTSSTTARSSSPTARSGSSTGSTR